MTSNVRVVKALGMAYRLSAQPSDQLQLHSMLLGLMVTGMMVGATGCGYQLRGYHSPAYQAQGDGQASNSAGNAIPPSRYSMTNVTITVPDDPTSFALKQPLRRALTALGLTVVNPVQNISLTKVLPQGSTPAPSPNPSLAKSLENASGNSSLPATARISVSNVNFQSYKLVGVLTEVRWVMTAQVTYALTRDGQPIEVTSPISVERSYQFNEATVSVEDQQGAVVRAWLYDSMAQRIADQYAALSLPRVPASQPKSPT